MHEVRIKVCGITNYEDARSAVNLGVHAIGFIFAPSPRQISPETAKDIIITLPPFVQSVGVFVNEAPDNIKKIVNFCGLDMVQLHGDESPEICSKLMPRVIKAFRIKNEDSIGQLVSYKEKTRAFLLDTYSKEAKGGTGKSFDWKLALKARELNHPIILAGGLSPSNILKAINLVRPFGVDVSSNIEERPGKKDFILMREFVKNIKNHGGTLR